MEENSREYLDSVILQSKQRMARIMDLEDAMDELQEALAMSASIIRSGERLSQQADDKIHTALTKAREVRGKK